MATTTNYAWETPDDTDLVKDGAAAIRTLGSSIDTTTKALNPSTTLGDIEYRSSTANTNTRLGIGSTGQVLTVAGGVPSWATASAGTWTQAATGSITGASVTVSGLSGKKYFVLLKDYSHNDTGTELVYVQLNGDTGANYYFTGSSSGVSQLQPNYFLSSAAETPTMGFYIDMADTSLPFKPVGGVTINSGAQGGWYNSTSAITSIKFYPSGSSWDGGTYYVWSFA